MEDVQHFDGLLPDAVRHNVRQASQDEFTRSFFASYSSQARGCLQSPNRFVELNYGLYKLRIVLGEIVLNVFQVLRGGGRPTQPRHWRNIRLTRASISSSSMNSPRSACSIPFLTPARKRASSSSRHSAASFTSSAGSTPSWVAILASFASSSGVNRTSIIAQTRRPGCVCQAGLDFLPSFAFDSIKRLHNS